jgi:transposase
MMTMRERMSMSTDSQTLFGEAPSEQRPKRKKAKSPQIFKRYQQHQVILLPPSLEDMIPEKHLVRVVNETIEKLDLKPLYATYKGDGTSAYHPLMLLKVLVYAYLSKVYSSRMIAKALNENVHFMWLSGMSHPDFRTINAFRSGRLKEVVDKVFGSMVVFLLDHGYVDLQQYFVDGTKLRADANKHKVVWKKNTLRYKERVQNKINELLVEIERTNAEEQAVYGDRDLAEQGEQTDITSDDVKQQITKLNEVVQQATPSPRVTKAIKEIETKLLPKLEKYEQQQTILAGRNSYSKTDPDATVFYTKDGQLLPSYNLLIGTQRQFILNYNFHQRKASECDALPAHLDHLHQNVGRLPALIMGDSAFGSQENYALLESKNMGNYLKYNTFYKEKTKPFREDMYRKEHFPYDAATDTFTCPRGTPLIFKESRLVMTDNGYPTTVRLYQSVDCRWCPHRKACKRGKGPRSIQINHMLERFRAQARANLNSEIGIALRKQRGIDVEPVFGDIKFNQGYNRSRLRGEQKMKVEVGLLSMAHNIKKITLAIN